MVSDASIIVWLRQDLRLADHAALAAAAASGRTVVPLFVLDDESPGHWRMGEASRWWLHGSLSVLAAELARLGAPLVLRRGAAAQTVSAVARETAASAVYCTACVEPHWQAADRWLAAELPRQGIAFRSFPGATAFDIGAIRGRDGRRLRVFTPFWRACMASPAPARPIPAPRALRAPAIPPRSDHLDQWGLRPRTPDWAAGLRETWRPGERHAAATLAAFADGTLARYQDHRDRPEPSATSGLSAHLHFGEISARCAWHAVATRIEADPSRAAGGRAWLRQLGWRDFYANVLALNPDAADEPLQRTFRAFPWASDDSALRAWQRGRTGFPIVDAGMRQLWHTGWMHNRARMITASFLVKHLLIPWQVGEAWFWDTLVDADLANNAGGWQWVAGCGTDAAPYFRIFNPVLQGEKFDPTGDYVRRWVPELASIPDRWLHRVWEAPPLERVAAGVYLGRNYPEPIVDHRHARARALAALARAKETC
jgi:deoxyribodipyrimidine photo-lyase